MDRLKIYRKYNGRCAYCGSDLVFKKFQIDHAMPVCQGGKGVYENLMPTCRRCNHYKRASTIPVFRESLLTLHDRIMKNYINKVGVDYGIISVKPFSGVFFFETYYKTKNKSFPFIEDDFNEVYRSRYRVSYECRLDDLGILVWNHWYFLQNKEILEIAVDGMLVYSSFVPVGCFINELNNLFYGKE